MRETIELVLVLALVLVFLLGVIGLRESRTMAARLTLEESLDHPDSLTRSWYRFWKWCVHYAVAVIVVLVVVAECIKTFAPQKPNGFAASMRDVPFAMLWVYVLATPLAAGLQWSYRKLAGSGDRRKRSARRKFGLPGYTVVPATLARAQANAPLTTAAPLTATPRAQDGMDDVLETGDPELVREVARKHWEAVHLAIASQRSQADAFGLQEAFLGKLDAIADPALRRSLLDAYAHESDRQAHVTSGLMQRQREILEAQAAYRQRARRNIKIISAFFVIGWLGLLLLSHLVWD